MSSEPGLRVALLGGFLLGFATPPALVPFGEWLALPALGVWYAIAIGTYAGTITCRIDQENQAMCTQPNT